MAPADPVDLERSLWTLPAEATQELVQESYIHVGHKLSDCESTVSALLLDVFLPQAPIVGISRGFNELTEKTSRSLLGQSVLSVLLEGVEENRISRSMCQEVENFLRMARLRQLCSMADCIVSHPFRRCGEVVQIKSCFHFLKVPAWLNHDETHHHLVLCVLSLGDEHEVTKLHQQLVAESLPPTSILFPAPLSPKCILLNGMSSAMRREVHLPRGCLCLSRQAVWPSQDGSYFFNISVDRVSSAWTSRLPFLGFTATSPTEIAADRSFFDTLPHAFCLATSCHIGGSGEGWLRSNGEVASVKLMESLEKGAERVLLSPLPEHRRVAPFVPRPGDVLGCRYQRNVAGQGSCISLFLNGHLAFEFHFQSELPSRQLYAVVDVCHCVYQVTMMPTSEDRLMGS